MALTLAVPAQRESGEKAGALKLGRTREWLSELPLLDAGASTSKVYAALQKSNRTAFKANTRLRHLELYRTPVQYIGQHLEVLVNDTYLPLPERHQKFAEMCRNVAVEMAYGYKIVVLELARHRRTNRQHDELTTAIHRAITYLTASLFQSAIYYNPAPLGTWNELHSLFVYAAKARIEKYPVEDPLNKSRLSSSIACAYQHALLFGLSNIYNNSVPVIKKLYYYLRRCARKAEVGRYVQPDTTRYKFVVDPEEDYPPRPYAKDMTLKKPRRLLLLDTHGVTKIAHDQWQQIRSGASPKEVGLGDAFFEGGGFEMLERVVLSLGIVPKRIHPRTELSAPYELGLGVSAANYFLNGGHPFEYSAEDTTPSRSISAGTFGSQQLRKREHHHVAQSWNAANESAGGLSLFVDLSEPEAVQVRVGEVVAVRPRDDESAWDSGVVRWVRTKDTELHIGIQKFGAVSEPVAIKPVNPGDAGEEIFKYGICLPQDLAKKLEPTLVVPSGVYQKQRNYFLDDGKTLKMIRAGSLLERNGNFERFKFELLNI